ncbi:hypothetical protein D3C85_1277120 [compost metagenome]
MTRLTAGAQLLPGLYRRDVRREISVLDGGSQARYIGDVGLKVNDTIKPPTSNI